MRNAAAEAAPHLTYAVAEALKRETRPPWLAPRRVRRARRRSARPARRADAIAMYDKFLEIAVSNDPDRRDAINALSDLGEPYNAPGGS